MNSKNAFLYLIVVAMLSQLNATNAFAVWPFPEKERKAAPTKNPPIDSNIDYQKQNASFKILVGLLGYGVDYSHPDLNNKMLVDLDVQNHPIGIGFDYVDNDKWPAPFVSHPVVSSEEEIKKNEIALTKLPELAQWFSKDRYLLEESLNRVHDGTHMAGLITQDSDAIGLIPYRTSFTIFHGDGNELTSFEYIKKGVDAAVKKGVRIIVFDRDILNFGVVHMAKDEKEKNLERKKQIIVGLEQLLATYPQVLFLQPIGDNGKWISNVNNFEGFCSLKSHPNVLCVGSLDINGDQSTKTNLPINSAQFVLVSGEKMLSTISEHYCAGMNIPGPDLEASCKSTQDNNRLQECIQKCQKTSKYIYMSGSQPATAIAAHEIANLWIIKPSLSPGQVVNQFLESAMLVPSGNMYYMARVIPVQKPKNAGDKEYEEAE